MDAYYWAGGHRIELESDADLVAVEQKIAERAGLDTTLKAAVGAVARIGGGVLIAQRSSLGEDTLARLREAGALQPVYRRERAVVVPLPEIRVELDNSQQRRAVMDFLAKTGSQHAITADADHQMVLRPASGNGDDALKMANQIYEHAHPAAASVRFVQFVPKPSS